MLELIIVGFSTYVNGYCKIGFTELLPRALGQGQEAEYRTIVGWPRLLSLHR